MRGVEVILPGGLPTESGVERRAIFRLLTGRVEQALLETEQSENWPDYVTAVLAAALERIGGFPADEKTLAGLCVADRHYLMLRLGAILNGEQMWLTTDCDHCRIPFDVDVKRCDLPVKEAGEDYPTVKLKIQGLDIYVRVPTGGDQAAVADREGEAAVLLLLKRCIRLPDGNSPDQAFIDSLSSQDIEMIDVALDLASPAVCNQLLVICPECGLEHQVRINQSSLAEMNRYFFYDEVHTIAGYYHWSEGHILDLPQERRRLYLEMINRTAGISV